ncbi:pectinesterase-like [Magnolia sinica]|uniref:pectinesterase-like n=1 Tax=Magnolia sinica TaxID=86752 RepID=UPI002659AA43|nr:pectinesterase-like [Magnolia sinica]
MPMYNLKRRTQILLSSIPISTLLLLLFVFHTTQPNPKTSKPLHIHQHLQIAKSTCEGTIHHDLCVSTLSSIPNLSSKSLPQIISSTINHTLDAVQLSASNCSGILHKLPKLDTLQKRALDDCLELFDDTIEQLHVCISDLSPNSASKHINQLQAFLSAAITNQYTCLDGFSHGDHHMIRPLIKDRLLHISHLVSNSLAILKKLPKEKKKRSREAFSGYGEMVDGFPSWVSKKDRRLLQMNGTDTKPDLIVAKDGSGNYTTISEAVEAAPNRSDVRFVIYIKSGAYLENVEVVKKKTNLMFVGDGIEKTVVKASRNVVDNYTTFRSATVAVVGSGFLARDISFENSAGPSKHQAVALRSGSDLSAFYRCSFVGYQDTLYAHSLRQFYKECDIYGTIDFIFGNAAAVFQNCNLYARKPNPNQKNIFTAQGREDPNQNTGISIQNCKVTAAADLTSVKSSFKTYLGRPWKQYSRTVFMESFIDDLIDPAGWLEWSGDFGLSTLYYGEYMNHGPGANTSSRVTWPGYRIITNASEARQFTVEYFIQGNEWLTSTAIPFVSGLK